VSEALSRSSTSSRAPTLLATPTYVLGKLGSHGQRLTQQAIADQGLLLPHFSVLTTLDDLGPLAQHDLAARLGLNSSHLVGYVDELEHRKALRRERDPEDRRRQMVSLTPTGRRLLARLRTPIDALQQQFLAVLTPHERDVLMDLLLRLLEHTDQAGNSNHAAPPQ
jgi:DNA-binding MarR family transcriptional regulator